MTRARIALLLSVFGAIFLLGCGARAVPSAAASSTGSSSSAQGTLAASGTDRDRGTPTPAAALSTGAPRAGLVPRQGSEQAPRVDRTCFLVALDPGHGGGGGESGAAANGVVERDSNLDMATRVGEFLKAEGVQVYYTRVDHGWAPGILGSGDTRSLTRDDLQARVIAANRVGADIFVSLHSNGSGDTSLRGFEVYYESRRPFADANYRLAQQLIDGALRGAANAGFPSANRGVIDAACWRNFNGRCVGLFILSPGGATTGPGGTTGQVKEATNMPAALLETLFVSNADDAAMLKNDAVRTAIARGIADGILRYLGVSA